MGFRGGWGEGEIRDAAAVMEARGVIHDAELVVCGWGQREPFNLLESRGILAEDEDVFCGIAAAAKEGGDEDPGAGVEEGEEVADQADAADVVLGAVHAEGAAFEFELVGLGEGTRGFEAGRPGGEDEVAERGVQGVGEVEEADGVFFVKGEGCVGGGEGFGEFRHGER